MAGTKTHNSDLNLQGKAIISDVPNSTGTVLTYNSTSKEVSTRTNSQIISDLGLNTDLTAYVKKTGDTMSGSLTLSPAVAALIKKDMSSYPGSSGFARDIFQLTDSTGIKDVMGWQGTTVDGAITLGYAYLGGAAYNVKNAIRWNSSQQVRIGTTGAPTGAYALEVDNHTLVRGNFDFTGNLNSTVGEAILQRQSVSRFRTNATAVILSGDTVNGALYFRPQGDAVITGQVIINGAGTITTSSHGDSSNWYQAYTSGYLYKGLLSTADLNTIVTSGHYVQTSNANATVTNNYPSALAGILKVFGTTTHVTQEYTTYVSNLSFRRYLYNNGTWTNWVQDWNSGNFPDYRNYGLGVTAGVIKTDLTTDFESGMYSANASTLNSPTPGASGSLIHLKSGAASYWSQIFVSGTSGTTPRIFISSGQNTTRLAPFTELLSSASANNLYVPFNGSPFNINLNAKNINNVNLVDAKVFTNAVSSNQVKTFNIGSVTATSLGIKLTNTGTSNMMGSFTVTIFGYAGRSMSFRINMYKYLYNWYLPRVTWVHGDSADILNIEFYKEDDSNHHVKVNFVTNFGSYTKMVITDVLANSGDALHIPDTYTLSINPDNSTHLLQSTTTNAGITRDSVLSVNGNHITTNTLQTGLTGNKTTAGDWIFNGTTATHLTLLRTGGVVNSNMGFGFDTPLAYIGLANSNTFAIANSNNMTSSAIKFWIDYTLNTANLPGQMGGNALESRDIGGYTINTTTNTNKAEMILRHNWSANNQTFGIGGISAPTSGSMAQWGMYKWLNNRTVNGNDGFFGWTGDTDVLMATALAGTGNRMVVANPSGVLSTQAIPANTGTVTSIGMTVPTGLSISGSPITTSGTLALSLQSGYSIPTTSSQSNWDNAFTFTSNFTTNYNDLVAIEALAGTDGYLRKDGVGAWSLVSSPVPDATATVPGKVKLFSDTVNTTIPNAVTLTGGRTYGVQLNPSGQMVVNVPWVDTNTVYTLPSATSTILGGVKLASDTIQSVPIENISATAKRTYGIQVNSSGQLVVNVPWADTNTTYTNGTGLNLTGTTFSANFGTTAGTIAEGNDSRINNGQTAFGWGNHASAGYAFANGTNATDTWVNASRGMVYNPYIPGKTKNASGDTYLQDSTYGSITGVLNSNGISQGNPTDNWYHRIKMLHDNSGGYHTQIAVQMSGANSMHYKRYENGVDYGWIKLWDNQNLPQSWINNWNYMAANGLQLNTQFTTITGSGLHISDNFYGAGESGIIDNNEERFLVGKMDEYYKYGSFIGIYDGINFNYPTSLIGIGRELGNQQDKVQLAGDLSVDTTDTIGQDMQLILNPLYTTNGDVRFSRNAHIYILATDTVRLPNKPILGQRIEIYNETDIDIEVMHEVYGTLFYIGAFGKMTGIVGGRGFRFDEKPVPYKKFDF